MDRPPGRKKVVVLDEKNFGCMEVAVSGGSTLQINVI